MLEAIETVDRGVKYYAFTFDHKGKATLGIYSLEFWTGGRKDVEAVEHADIELVDLEGHLVFEDDELDYEICEYIEGGS